MKRSINIGLPIPDVGGDVDLWGTYIQQCFEILDIYGGEIKQARGTFYRLVDRLNNTDETINSIEKIISIASQTADYNLTSTLRQLLGFKKNCVNLYLAGSSFTRDANGVVHLQGSFIFNAESTTRYYLYKTPADFSASVTPAGDSVINLIIEGDQSNPTFSLEAEPLGPEEFVSEISTGTTAKIRIGFLVGNNLYKIPGNRSFKTELTTIINVSDGVPKHNQWETVHQLGFCPSLINLIIQVQSQDGNATAWIQAPSDVMVTVVRRHTVSFSVFPKRAVVDGNDVYYVYYDGSYYYDKIIKGKLNIEA
jgi:hypothetical protein